MSEFVNLVRELVLGNEPYDDEKARRSLKEATARYDSRMRFIRGLFFVETIILCGFAVWAAIEFFGTAAEDTRAQIGWATLFLFLMLAIGFLKGFTFYMHTHTVLLKELKRMEFRLGESKDGGK